MTTTWPRYPHIESEADCAQCSYSSYQHSCGQQRIEHEGRAVHNSAVYPSDTYPRPVQQPACCQVEQVSEHHQLPVKSKREAKRERREAREREQREREQRHHSRSQEHHRQSSLEHPQHHSKVSEPVVQPQPGHQQQQKGQPAAVPDCVDCAAAAAGAGPTPSSVTVTTGATVSANMQVDMSGYQSARSGARDVEQGGGYAGTGKRERDGVESGYSTQNRDEREKETKEGAAKTGAKPDQADPIQYIEGDGCQVWRPQVRIKV